MKIEKVISAIRKQLGANIGIDFTNGKDHTALCFYDNDAEVIIQALEKQIAKKPINGATFKHIGQCPDCGQRISTRSASSNCQYCGQKIDWGKL